MKILLSAFSFAPHQGSEPGVGWRWALELARDHDVVVLTDATRRAAAQAELQRVPAPRLEVVYHRPGWLRSVPLNSRTAQLLYAAWQFSLLPIARQLHSAHRFDLLVHLTYGVFRHASLLGALGVPFVFGPVGGGEDAPRRLKRSIAGRERAKEALRSLLNRLALIDPTLWWSLAKADLILTKTDQTRVALPWPFRRRAVVFPEIGIDAPEGPVGCTERASGEPLRALFAGRLLGWKGVHLAMWAVAQARSSGRDIRLDIVGSGPYEATLRGLHRRLALEDSVRFMGHVSQRQLFEMYRAAHVLLFPSLHDSSGNVVLEAQAFGCPVICLDIGGPATLVTPRTAFLVATAKATEQQVAQGLAASLNTIFDDEPRRATMARAAQYHARAMTWESRAVGCLRLAYERGLIQDLGSGLRAS